MSERALLGIDVWTKLLSTDEMSWADGDLIMYDMKSTYSLLTVRYTYSETILMMKQSAEKSEAGTGL